MTGKRVDQNHRDIKQAVCQLGGIWLDMTQARRSPIHCDAIVLYRGHMLPVEVKAPGKREDLTDDERHFHDVCGLKSIRVWILENFDDIQTMMESVE